jgi:hypothetical protein
MGQRIVFWLLGAALFVAIALMPNLLMAWFYTGGRVHAIVLPTIVVLIALLWGSSKAARASH